MSMVPSPAVQRACALDLDLKQNADLRPVHRKPIDNPDLRPCERPSFPAAAESAKLHNPLHVGERIAFRFSTSRASPDVCTRLTASRPLVA